MIGDPGFQLLVNLIPGWSPVRCSHDSPARLTTPRDRPLRSPLLTPPSESPRVLQIKVDRPCGRSLTHLRDERKETQR